MADVDAASMARALAPASKAKTMFWICGVAAAAAVAFFGYVLRDHWFAPPPVVTAALVEVRPEPGANWFQTKRRNLDRIDLIEGSLWLRIRRLHSENRVVIGVPDGEIEDFGTVLTVRVANGRMTRVVVEEGHIALRLKDTPEVRIHAGEMWTAPQEVAPESATLAPALDRPRPDASIEGHAAPKSSHAKRAASEDAVRGRVIDEATQESVREIDAGNAEDRAYIEIVDLVRAGKTSAARAAARDYLRRFPDGFRRVEVREVATGRTGPR